MKIFYFYSIFLIAIFCNKNLFSQTRNCKSSYNVTATFYPYTTAMGKGKGIIFRINIVNKLSRKCSIDSFFVNSKSLPFTVKNNSNGISLESNYLENTSEPTLNKDGSTNKPKEIDDEIITQHKFSPSSILINESGNKIKLRIETFSEIKQKIKH